MNQSGEQLNHAIKRAWSYDQRVPGVEARYLRIIQGLVAYIGGEVTLDPRVLEAPVDFMVLQNESTGAITLRTQEFNDR